MGAPPWTNHEITRLKRIIPERHGRPRGRIVEMFPGRTWQGIFSKACELGLTKRRRFLAPGRPKVVAQFFKALERQHGSLAEIARALGVAPSAVCRWRAKNATIQVFDAAVRAAGYRLVLEKIDAPQRRED